MKECSVLGATSRILAIDALETCLPNSIWISPSFPSSFDGSREPFGRPSKRPRARAAARPSLVRSEIKSRSISANKPNNAMNLDPTRLADYAARQHTVSDHQHRIRQFLRLTAFGPRQARALERFLFEESCRVEPTAALSARVREFLRERRVLFPAESALLRIVGEQRRRA